MMFDKLIWFASRTWNVNGKNKAMTVLWSLSIKYKISTYSWVVFFFLNFSVTTLGQIMISGDLELALFK